MTVPQPPPGQGPVDFQGAFVPPPPPSGMATPLPPMQPLPPMYPPPPKGSFARGILMTVATSIFGLSIALNVYLLIFTGVLSGDEFRQNVLVSGDPSQKVAVVPILGLMDDQASQRFAKTLRRLSSDRNVKALVLELDTPGGTITAADEIYHSILTFKQSKKVPVVVSMGSVAASGGYYVSCAADRIVAQRTSLTGSIGVLWLRYDLSKLAEKWGIQDSAVYPAEAPYKPTGSPLKPMTPQEHDHLLELVEDAYSTFKNVVSTGRSGRLRSPMSEIASGKLFTAAQSLDMGLIDQIGYPTDAYDLAASLAKLSNKHVVRYEPAPSLLQALGAGSETSLARTITVNGVNVAVDGKWFYELTTPRLMYLWRGP